MMRDKKPAWKIGAMTYLSFVLVGLIPLIVYVWDYASSLSGDLFMRPCLFTSFAFITIGFFKSYVTETSRWKSIAETLLLGAAAAAVAYFVEIY